jgi:hypothetical protein
MGLAEMLLGSQNPFAQFVAGNRNAIRGAGAGLASGPDFGQGLANAAMYANQGAAADDAYALTLKEKADREAQMQKSIDYLRSSNPKLAELVAAGMDPNQAFGTILEGFKPTPAPNPTDDIQEYQFALSNGFNGSFADWMTSNKGGVNVNLGPNGIDYGNPGDGLVWKRDPQNNVVLDERGAPIAIPYQGGKAWIAEQNAAAAGEKTDLREDTKANVVVQDIDRALTGIAANPALTTGVGAQLTSGLGGSPAKNVAELIGTVKANAGFAELQAMREASPTGGALGNVTEREIAYLQSTIGSLEQSQEPVQLADNLKRVKNAYLDIIHGVGKGPARERLSFEGGGAPGSTVSAEVQALLDKYK